MRPDYIPLYPDHPKGALRANRVGSFVKGGQNFDLIHPGYDVQGRRRMQWVQVVHQGVPIYEHKVGGDPKVALEKFNRLWSQFIAPQPDLLAETLAMTLAHRTKLFKNGVTGEEPAPSVSRDGRGQGERYTS